MKLIKSLFLLIAILISVPVLAQKDLPKGVPDLSLVKNIRVVAGTLPQNANDKQEFTVRWDADPGSRKFESFLVEMTLTREDGSSKSDTKQVNWSAREVVFKLKGNSKQKSSLVKVTANSTVAFSCTEKFSRANLSVNEPPPTDSIKLGLVDIQSITPLNAEEAKKKQTFDVKFKLPATVNPGKISKFQIAMDNNTVESDKKTPNPAAGSVTLKVKSPGAPVSAIVTATGENKIAEIAQANVSFLVPPTIKK